MKGIYKKLLLLFVAVLSAGVITACGNSNTQAVESLQEETSVNETSEAANDTMTADITIVGDFLYEEPYYESLRNGDDKSLYFSKVKKYFQNDDLSIGNMEVVISDGNMEISGVGYSFCAPEWVGDQVIDLGMDVMSTANNHSNDRGYDGRLSTINYFKNNSGILPVGTFADSRDVLGSVRDVNGIKFGFLSYTYATNEPVPYDLRYSVGLFRDPDVGGITDEYLGQIRNEVEALRPNVDCLVVMMHWGNEFTFEPTSEQRELAQFLNELGVDIIVGSHSHCMQPVEWIHGAKDTLCYYSMGNFVSADHIVDRTGETFTNAYQVALLSCLKVSKENGEIKITGIHTMPVVDYYDTELRNYTLIPIDEYTADYESSHYLYNANLTREFVENTFEQVVPAEFR